MKLVFELKLFLRFFYIHTFTFLFTMKGILFYNYR